MKKIPFFFIIVFSLCIATCGIYFYVTKFAPIQNKDTAITSIALLIEDNFKTSDPQVAVWADAAKEEGIPLKIISTSQFLRPTPFRSGEEYAGIIMPDSVAKIASQVLVDRLGEYTRGGGKLMLVYDAATRSQAGKYYPERAPLSNLAGIDYVLYDTLQAYIGESGAVWGNKTELDALFIPPGKSHPFEQSVEGLEMRNAEAIVGYQYGNLRYNSYITRGEYGGKRLLSSASGSLIAGYKQQGQGGVLFVNLPLGYLKSQTDGLLLHNFLRYFSESILSLPSLSPVPEGKGGLIFNWHVDSNAAIRPITNLENTGILNQGPFSIHFTAGPDAREFGDGLGLNLEKNIAMQSWMQRFKERGDALGNHGGWIHDYFGLNVSENNQQEMEKFLKLNNKIVAAANGAPIREYSAPQGNQPKWITAWLETHGYVAYYFTGNGGMGATRSYREGKLWTSNIWSFPAMTFNKIASFEEAEKAEINQEEMLEWLTQLTNFTSDHGVVRTIYSHPPGFQQYAKTIDGWFARTAELQREKRFSWYTMTQIADFLNRRELVEWRTKKLGATFFIEAKHPTDLKQFTWKIPKHSFSKPVIKKGSATIVERDKYWLVVSNNGKVLELMYKNLTEAVHEK